MTRRSLAAALLLLVIARPARAQDQLDLHQVVVHDSPLDIASWPITVSITRMRETPGASGGLAFETQPAMPGHWQSQTFPQDHPQTGTFCAPAGGTDGCIQYTVWALAKIGGVWHGAGFIQMWMGRTSTGAPMLAQFHSDWAYACDRWGQELCHYVPQIGDQMAFFLSAGNARDFRDVSSVRERSQVVLLTVPANDTADLSFPVGGGPPPPPPQPPPVQPPAPVVDLAPRVQSLEAAVALLVNQLAAATQAATARLEAGDARLRALEAKPIPTSCTARVFGTVVVSCRLNP